MTNTIVSGSYQGRVGIGLWSRERGRWGLGYRWMEQCRMSGWKDMESLHGSRGRGLWVNIWF